MSRNKHISEKFPRFSRKSSKIIAKPIDFESRIVEIEFSLD